MNNRLWYPAFFRVAIALLLFIDLAGNLLYVQHIYKIPGFTYALDSTLPFSAFLRDHISLFLSCYLIILILFLFGIGRNITSALVFLFITLDFFLIYPAVFWGDYVLKITLLYFIFTDSFQHFTLFKSKESPGIFHRLSVLAIMLNLCLVYLSNAYFKLHSPEWINGSALAYFFGFSEVLDLNNIHILFRNQEWLIRSATWSVLIYQITFPFLIWFKKLKWVMIAAGILIHAIMAVTLQLYKFELIMILLYGFFVTDEEWKQLFGKIKLKNIHGKR